MKNELDSWMFHRESPDILDSKKELLTQHLVTNKIIYRYVAKLNSNYDLLSNEISHEPYPQERSNVLAYLRQFWQNDLSSHKIRKLDLVEKWAFSALERNILFSVTTRRRSSLLNMPCHDIPISLQSGLLPSKGILLVGPIETGRSSIIRDVAFDSYFPVVKLPLKKLIYNRSFFNNVRGNFISKNQGNSEPFQSKFESEYAKKPRNFVGNTIHSEDFDFENDKINEKNNDKNNIKKRRKLVVVGNKCKRGIVEVCGRDCDCDCDFRGLWKPTKERAITDRSP